jgi:predicted membrane-bound dolichyl-phosphate-mannose-protein mannosyltransferase
VAPDAPYAGAAPGLDPNTEHPPLGKLAIAGSMRILGDNPLGWRVPSIMASVAIVLLSYALVRALHGTQWQAVFVAAVVAADNLSLVHGRIATLDEPMLAFILLGALLLLRGRPILAGTACGVAFLVKTAAIFGVFSLLLFVVLVRPNGLDGGQRPRRRLLPCAGVLAGFALTSFFGLWLLDAAWSPYRTPWSHLARMSDYGLSLRPATVEPSSSQPWRWLLNEGEMTYLRVDRTTASGDEVIGQKTTVHFRGMFNPAVVGVASIGLFLCASLAFRTGAHLPVWAITWFIGNFAPYLVLHALTDRPLYIFYALPLVPTFVVSVVPLLWAAGLPRAVRWGYAAAVVLGVAVLFPFRTIG